MKGLMGLLTEAVITHSNVTKNTSLVGSITHSAGNIIKALLTPMRAAVNKQDDHVRALKVEKATENDIKTTVDKLKAKKKVPEDKELALRLVQVKFDRTKINDILRHFVLEEQLLEVNCTMLDPEPILAAYGHVERSANLMVKDLKNGECFRRDHLIKAALEKACADMMGSVETRFECEEIVSRLDGATKEGMAKCADWSITKVTNGPQKYHDNKKPAKEKKLVGHQAQITANYVKPARVKPAQGSSIKMHRCTAMIGSHPEPKQPPLAQGPHQGEEREAAGGAHGQSAARPTTLMHCPAT